MQFCILDFWLKYDFQYCYFFYFMRYDDFWLLQGWLYRLEMDGSSQAKLLLDRFVARAAELKIPVSRIKVYFGIIFHPLSWSGIYLPGYEIILKKFCVKYNLQTVTKKENQSFLCIQRHKGNFDLWETPALREKKTCILRFLHSGILSR